MGDLNIRYNKTVDKEQYDCVNKANKTALTKFLKSANYSILLDSNTILNETTGHSRRGATHFFSSKTHIYMFHIRYKNAEDLTRFKHSFFQIEYNKH